ncbi:MAG: MerR family transcriptional regulator [Thermomicrobiales bacterium]
MTTTTLTTRDLAQAAGISEQAIRDYEAGNLLPPVPRHENGYRAFTAIHLAALLVIRALKEAGYARKEMRRAMDAVHAGRVPDALALLDAHNGRLWERRVALAHSSRRADPVPADARREAVLSIGEAARRVGVRPSTLRFWESMDVIRVARDPSSSFRQYRAADLDRLAAIKRLRGLGVPWTEIGDALRAPGEVVSVGVDRGEGGLVRDIDRQSWLNARATAMVCCYATMVQRVQGGAGDDVLALFLDAIAS